MSVQNKSIRYELWLAFIFFLTWGFIFLDRLALSYILPYMLDELALNNTQIGQVNMWQTIGFAIAAPFFSLISDRLGNRKRVLIISVFLTAIFSGMTMLVQSYGTLLALRFAVGVSEGAILPLAVAITAAFSTPGKFGRNVGIIYCGAAVIASTLGPTFATQMAELTNWRMAYLLVSLPSFLIGFVIWKFVKEPPRNPDAHNMPQERFVQSLFELLKYRNIVVCIIMCILTMAGIWIYLGFTPLYLTTNGGLSPERMGFVMSVFGLVAILWQFGMPSVSDYTGRKPAMIVYSILCCITPLALYLYPGHWISIASIIAFGGVIVSLTSMHVSIIPTETVPPRLAATSSALIMGIGEFVGAFVVGLAGSLADIYGLPVVMLVGAVAYMLTAIVAFALVESNPRKLKTSVAQTSVKT
jgi:predicted MFS family arabinose efflux permease